MIESELEDRYGIEMHNVIIADNNGIPPYNKKMMVSRHHASVGGFLTCWNDPDEVSEELLPVIENVVNGIVPNDSTDSEVHWVDVFPDVTKFYSTGAGVKMDLEQPASSISTIDFKEIVLAWKDFLLEPPLHGAQVDKNGRAINTQELINTYQLDFANLVINLHETKPFVDKFPYTVNDELSMFLECWSTVNEIDSIVLPVIKRILNENLTTEDISGGGTFIVLNSSDAVLYGNAEDPVMTISTRDLYDIIILWRAFLLEEPLNGTITENRGFYNRNSISGNTIRRLNRPLSNSSSTFPWTGRKLWLTAIACLGILLLLRILL